MMWFRRKSCRTGKPITCGKPRRPLEVELLETRTVLSTLLVTTTGNQGAGSLRQAIADANALPAAETVNIVFNIPTSDTGILTISLTSAISAITHANVTIDGTTQPGYSASLPVTGGSITVTRPKVEITPNPTKPLNVGLDVQANNVTLKGLSIHGFGQANGTGDKADVRVGNNFTGTVIVRNLIGTSATAFARPAAGYVSGGNAILVVGGDNGLIQQNLIGFTSAAGVALQTGSNGWTIGGTGLGNAVSGSTGAGVTVATGSTGNRISQNSIFGNSALGIDLGPGGVTPNDNPDADGYLNFPVLDRANLSGSNLTLYGSARGGATVEVFVADVDPSGNGEGKIYLATFTAPSGSGTVPFTYTFTPSAGAVAAGSRLTATAALGGSTSEFSGNVTLNAAPTLSGVPASATIPEMAAYTFTATATDPDQPANTLTFSLVAAPAGAAINSSGVFTWTPTEAQDGVYNFNVRVTDNGGLY